MTTDKVTIGNAEIAYRIDGDYGKPWLILSNSLATTHAMWQPQLTALTDRFRVLRYDTRGHGDSSAPTAPYSFADLTADAIGLMNAMAIERTAFMGLSLGGMTGLGLALDYPDRISRLICCDARADAPDIYQQMWPANIERARQGGMEAVVAPTLERWFTDDFRASSEGAEIVDETGDLIRQTAVEGYVGCASALMQLDYLPRLHQIKIPCLFLGGEHDMAAPVATMQEMADAVPGASFQQIDGAAHLSNLERPGRFTNAVQGWLADN